MQRFQQHKGITAQPRKRIMDKQQQQQRQQRLHSPAMHRQLVSVWLPHLQQHQLQWKQGQQQGQQQHQNQEQSHTQVQVTPSWQLLTPVNQQM
jgi:hypothetical protein